MELILLGAIWGSSFLFMRVATADFGPFALVELRLVLGSLVLLPFLWRARQQLTPHLWLQIAWISAINSAIPFALFAWGAEHAPAGIGAITNAMTVLFATVIAYLFYAETIDARRALGLLAGFVGVAVLASGKVAGTSVWPAALAGTGASLLYGIGVNVIRRHLHGVPASAVASATLLCASVLMAPFAIYTWPHKYIPALSWTCVVLLGVLCTGTAYALYYRLIVRVGASRAAAVTYLIPVFGVVWAWLFLGEPLTLTMAVSGVMILGGVAVSQQRRR